MSERITLTVQEAARYIGVSASTIYAMAREDEIPHVKVRGRYLFNKDIIEDWTKYPHKYSLQKEVN